MYSLSLLLMLGCTPKDTDTASTEIDTVEDSDNDGIPFAFDCDDNSPGSHPYEATRLHSNHTPQQLYELGCDTTSERYILQGSTLFESSDDLHLLSCLCGIEGNLTLDGEWDSLEGLENLRFVLGELDLDPYGTTLVSTTPLDGLVRVGTLYLRGDERIALDGLRRLQEVDENLFVSYHTGAPDPGAAFGALTRIGGLLYIHHSGFRTLEHFRSLRTIGGDLDLGDNEWLTNIADLGGLEHLGGDLIADNNPSLSDDAVWELVDLIGAENIDGEVVFE